MDDRKTSITIDFEIAEGQLAGRASDASGRVMAFTGWLELLATLDTLVRSDLDGQSTQAHTE